MLCPCRLWEKALHVEVEWTVGPIPIADNKGKEVVLRYASSLDSGRSTALLPAPYMPSCLPALHSLHCTACITQPALYILSAVHMQHVVYVVACLEVHLHIKEAFSLFHHCCSLYRHSWQHREALASIFVACCTCFSRFVNFFQSQSLYAYKASSFSSKYLHTGRQTHLLS